MEANKVFSRSRIAALVFAVAGTLIFAAYYHDDQPLLVQVAFVFMAIAAIISGRLLSDCQQLMMTGAPPLRKKARFHAGILLLNLPLCLLFVSICFRLTGYERLLLVNDSGYLLTGVELIGCAANKPVGTLAVGERTEVWVPINGDCAIDVAYRKDGEPTREILVGYTTPGAGRKSKHFIGRPEARNVR